MGVFNDEYDGVGGTYIMGEDGKRRPLSEHDIGFNGPTSSRIEMGQTQPAAPEIAAAPPPAAPEKNKKTNLTGETDHGI
jgi:hypothetical protein